MPTKKASAPKYIAPVGGHYVDPNRAGEIRFEAGDELPEFAAEALGFPAVVEAEPEVLPAPAGSNKPGNDDDGSAK